MELFRAGEKELHNPARKPKLFSLQLLFSQQGSWEEGGQLEPTEEGYFSVTELLTGNFKEVAILVCYKAKVC